MSEEICQFARHGDQFGKEFFGIEWGLAAWQLNGFWVDISRTTVGGISLHVKMNVEKLVLFGGGPFEKPKNTLMRY